MLTERFFCREWRAGGGDPTPSQRSEAGHSLCERRGVPVLSHARETLPGRKAWSDNHRLRRLNLQPFVLREFARLASLLELRLRGGAVPGKLQYRLFQAI